MSGLRRTCIAEKLSKQKDLENHCVLMIGKDSEFSSELMLTYLTIPSLVATKTFVLGAGTPAMAENARPSFGCA